MSLKLFSAKKIASYRLAQLAVPLVFLLISILTASRLLAQNETYTGNYRVAPDHWLGIDRFHNDSGKDVLLLSDYQSGIVRQIFPNSETEFVMGPGFDVKAPIELTVRFQKNVKGNVTGMSLVPFNGTPVVAERVSLHEEAVNFYSGDAKLSGTLLMPATKGPHPAIVLLHGSGPLTRSSFGPYPHFFTSLGFAVLIYDKRGTGDSTGTLLDANQGISNNPTETSYYPDALTNDALSALEFLKKHDDIDLHRIGFWGSSEGGMLTTQVAARSKDVAFIINSSGPMEPIWQTVLYQMNLKQRFADLSDEDMNRHIGLNLMWMNVARTGVGWQEFVTTREEGIKNGSPWVTDWSRMVTSYDQLRWGWEHVLKFSALPALVDVNCPILAIYGEKDVLVEASVSAENLRSVLSASGKKDFTIKIFPDAGHSLAEEPSGSRMAPGLFETIRVWLRIHSQAAE